MLITIIRKRETILGGIDIMGAIKRLVTQFGELDWFTWIKTLISAAAAGGAQAFLTATAGVTMLGATAFTPRQLQAMILFGGLSNIALILKKSPFPDRVIATALSMPPGSTQADLSQVLRSTAPGTVPTPAEAAQILVNNDR